MPGALVNSQSTCKFFENACIMKWLKSNWKQITTSRSRDLIAAAPLGRQRPFLYIYIYERTTLLWPLTWNSAQHIIGRAVFVPIMKPICHIGMEPQSRHDLWQMARCKDRQRWSIIELLATAKIVQRTFYSMWVNDTTWRQSCWSTLFHVMVCCQYTRP